MSKFTNVVVPVDGSDDSFAALAPAASLAKAFDATVTIVAAWGDLHQDVMQDQIDQYIGDLTGVEHETLLLRFDRPIAYLITNTVDECEEAIVCMTTHGRGRSAALRGSVAAEVLERVTCPVVLVGPECESVRIPRGGQAFVCTDGSPFADSILPFAEDFARALELSTEVVTVLDNADLAMANAAVGAEHSGAIAESAHVRTLSDELADSTGTPSTYAVLHGNHPAKSILDRADQDKPALIAMATHDEYRLRRVIHSSVTAQVARRAKCPVLTFRPEE